MNLIKELWFYSITKLYFWLFESASLETVEVEAITHEFSVHGKEYIAFTRETKYIIAYTGRIPRTKEFNIYNVRMKMTNDLSYTEDWYPLLVPTYLNDLNMGHTQAVRLHWQKYYSYRS